MKRSLRNTSRQAPLTPSIPAARPSPVMQPSPADWSGDATVIYQELLWWRQRAKAMERAYHEAVRKYNTEQDRFTRYRAKGLARGIAKRFTPNHNPKETL
jgi:hypothetical protein